MYDDEEEQEVEQEAEEEAAAASATDNNCKAEEQEEKRRQRQRGQHVRQARRLTCVHSVCACVCVLLVINVPRKLAMTYGVRRKAWPAQVWRNVTSAGRWQKWRQSVGPR